MPIPTSPQPTLVGGADINKSDTRQSRLSTTSQHSVSLRDKMHRALSPGRDDPSGRSFFRSMSEEPRGRDPLISTGRGGAGNLVRSISKGPDTDAAPGAERGREVRGARGVSAERTPITAFHSGRGGAGNIRSPSRDPKREAIEEAQEDALQDKLIAERRGRQAEQPFTTGRGGVGNITASRSRSRSAVRTNDSPSRREASQTRRSILPGHSGRGGYGNLIEEQTESEEQMSRRVQEDLYEAGVKKKFDEQDAKHPHTSGRGGAGSVGTDLTPVDLAQLSLEEREAHLKMAAKDHGRMRAGGRGGAGNMTASDDRGRGSSPAGNTSVFGSMLRSLSRATGRDGGAAPAR